MWPGAAVSPAPMKTNAEQRQRSIEKLLGAALRLFVSQGYRSTTLEQIAAAARLTKGAVYFYFGSKEKILLELLTRVEPVIVDEMIEVTGRAGPSAIDGMVAFVNNQAKLGIARRNEVLLLILMSLEFGGGKGAVTKAIGRIYRRLHRHVESLIRRGQNSGELRNNVPVRELAAIVMANHDGAFLEWHRRDEALHGANLVRALRSILLHGLVRSGAAKRRSLRTKKTGVSE